MRSPCRHSIQYIRATTIPVKIMYSLSYTKVEVVVSGDQAEDIEDTERLVVSMAKAPLHGSVVLETGTATGPAGTMEVEMRDISVADLRTTGVRLVYQHDGSESSEDSFALTLSNGNQVRDNLPVVPENKYKTKFKSSGMSYVV